jgi:minor extracellular serine protease Vpr
MLNVAVNVRTSVVTLVTLAAGLLVSAAPRSDRWIVILQEPPVAAQSATREDVQSKAFGAPGNRIAAQQRGLRASLASRPKVTVTGSVDTLANALFIAAPEEEIEAIEKLPGVVRVLRQRYYKRHDAKAAELVRAAGGWAGSGGEQNAGSGIRIAIVDSGIDKNHPSFQDPSLPMPAGFPKCLAEHCEAYTSNKVIAARSFVELLAFADVPLDSRPDDYSPRDRIGHGTAVRVKGPAAEVQGVAPKAYLGNYKVFGSPGVNEFASDEAVIRALEAAFNDGMDIASLSLGAPALWAPEDRDRTCGSENVGPCDLQVDAVENATRLGMVVVADAGNQGDAGERAPALGSITTPGTAPGAITVGGSTNSHIFFSTVRPEGGSVPSNIREIDAQLTNGLKPRNVISATLVDVASLSDPGTGCQPLGNGALTGAIALIARGDCDFAEKLRFAEASGAIAAIFMQSEGSDALFPIGNLRETGIPAVLIGNTAGKRLKTWIAANPRSKVTIDPALVELDVRDSANEVAYFSSYGPSIGSLAIKPELVAVATDMYMATQTYDPNGDMFDPSGFYATQGNSFAAPQVAGAVALLKQKYPQATPAQLKSAVVNTADPDVVDFDSGGQPYRARVVGVGAGKLDVSKAVATNVVVEPSVLSFGIAFQNRFPVRTLRFTNLGTSSVNLRFTVERRDADNSARVNLSSSTLNLGARQSGTVTATVAGNAPPAGNYEGVVRVEGGAVPLRIPFLYMSGDNVPFNVIPLEGDGFVREPGRLVRMTMLVVDRYGVPVVGCEVLPQVSSGGGTFPRNNTESRTTDDLGIYSVAGITGNQLGLQSFRMSFCGSTASQRRFTYDFFGRNRQTPTIQNGGIVNAASGQGGRGLAAGSLIAITGVGLSEARQLYSTSYLPLSLSNVSVSFDDRTRKTSFPGRIRSVSDREVIVQIPWEVEGMDRIETKVSIGYTHQTDLVDLTLARHSPGIFEYMDASGRLVASALDENGNPVGSENPVASGAVLNLLVTGLGPVNNRPASGEAPSGMDSTTHAVPVVTIGGAAAEVQFSGLAPNLPGMYLVRVTVPSGIGSGTQAVALRIDGVEAKSVNTVIR